MADITKCSNQKCPKRDKCYRATAPDTPLYQSYAHFNPENKEECDDMWEINPTPKKKPKSKDKLLKIDGLMC